MKVNLVDYMLREVDDKDKADCTQALIDMTLQFTDWITKLQNSDSNVDIASIQVTLAAIFAINNMALFRAAKKGITREQYVQFLNLTAQFAEVCAVQDIHLIHRVLINEADNETASPDEPPERIH